MAIPDGVLKLTFSGTFGGGVEQWAFSLWFTGYTGVNGSAETSFDASQEPSGTAYEAFRTGFLTYMSSVDHYTALDAYYYQGGVATQHGTMTFDHPGLSNTTGPTQLACVMTLRTALSTRRGRGRIYLPLRAIAVGGNGLMDANGVNANVDRLATYLSAQLLGGRPGVVVSTTAGNTHPITQVDADLVPDTQRRRVNKLRSSRHASAVTPD